MEDVSARTTGLAMIAPLRPVPACAPVAASVSRESVCASPNTPVRIVPRRRAPGTVLAMECAYNPRGSVFATPDGWEQIVRPRSVPVWITSVTETEIASTVFVDALPSGWETTVPNQDVLKTATSRDSVKSIRSPVPTSASAFPVTPAPRAILESAQRTARATDPATA